MDKHVVKMVLEYSQLLCAAHHLVGATDPLLYKLTHVNHPCARWVRESSGNYSWLHSLLVELLTEYTYRYEKIHRVRDCGLESLLYSLPPNISRVKMTQPPQAMPDEFKDSDSVMAYRRLYRTGKSHLHSWKKRGAPEWIFGVCPEMEKC